MDLSVSQKRVGATHRLGGDKMRSDEVAAEGSGSKHGRTDSRGQGAEKTGRGALSRGAGAVKHAASATVGGVKQLRKLCCESACDVPRASDELSLPAFPQIRVDCSVGDGEA